MACLTRYFGDIAITLTAAVVEVDVKVETL